MALKICAIVTLTALYLSLGVLASFESHFRAGFDFLSQTYNLNDWTIESLFTYCEQKDAFTSEAELDVFLVTLYNTTHVLRAFTTESDRYEWQIIEVKEETPTLPLVPWHVNDACMTFSDAMQLLARNGMRGPWLTVSLQAGRRDFQERSYQFHGRVSAGPGQSVLADIYVSTISGEIDRHDVPSSRTWDQAEGSKIEEA